MDRLVASTGRVAHISASIVDGPEGRVITTFCGKTFLEDSLRVDNDKNECKTCTNKYESAVDSTTDTELSED